MRSLLLLLLLVGLARANYTTKAGCEALMKDPSDCECLEQRIKCGMVTLDSNEHLRRITCATFDARGFDYLPDLKAGNISKLTISNCAFPHQDVIRQLISRLGITNYTELEIENSFEQGEGRNEVLQQHYSNLAGPGLHKLTLVRFKSPLPARFLENCSDLTQLTLLGSSDLPGTLLQPLTRLTRLTILVRNMANVASELFSKQTQLQRLSLDCGLKNSSVEMSTLTSQELWHMPNLTSFELRNCGDNVPSELFWKSDRLQYISIQSNISYLGREFLKAQANLLALRLARNNIARLPDELFRQTPLLLEIHLAHNNLERIQSGLFDKIRNLQILNLEHNPITTVASNAFAAIPSARIYLGDLYKLSPGKDWARATNATLCEEEYISGACVYCKRDEYLDHFAEKETCNKPNDPGKLEDILKRKYIQNRLKHQRLGGSVEQQIK